VYSSPSQLKRDPFRALVAGVCRLSMASRLDAYTHVSSNSLATNLLGNQEGWFQLQLSSLSSGEPRKGYEGSGHV
jgi:hypothetical protein